MKEKILVSACFLGERVRYDGQHQQLTHNAINRWLNEHRIISACPECLGGLPVPREPAEIQPGTKKIITVLNEDVSEQFHLGAIKTLTLCQQKKIKFALLKESSPSCGSHFIYDGSFTNQKVNGQGVTAKLLTKNGIRVFSENDIQDLIDIIN